MRALQFSAFGKPADVLELVDLPEPEPKEGQVRVRLSHRPINPSDLLYIQGKYGIIPHLPAIPGFEGAGRVDKVGKGVLGVAVKQRVVPMGVTGTWRGSVIAREGQLTPVPDNVSDQAAAQLGVNPVTAWVMVTKELDVKPGEWLLQTAAGSTLGRLVLQLAKVRGFKTINFVRRRDQVQEILDLGADAVICTEDPDPVGEVMKITRGQGVNAAIDAVGGQTGGRAAKCLRTGGTMLVYGLLSEERIPLDSGDMIFKGSTVRGFWLSRWYLNTPSDAVQATIREVIKMMGSGHLAPPVEKEYDLEQFKAAIANAEQPGRRGKVLLTG